MPIDHLATTGKTALEPSVGRYGVRLALPIESPEAAMTGSADAPLHILLTNDGSALSLSAIEPTCALARRTRARITLLRVLPELITSPGSGFAVPEGILRKTGEAEIAAERAELVQLLPRFGDVDVSLGIEVAESATAGIMRYAHEHGIDLIAMASHGRTGLRRILLGSTAESVLRASCWPVLIFPTRAVPTTQDG